MKHSLIIVFCLFCQLLSAQTKTFLLDASLTNVGANAEFFIHRESESFDPEPLTFDGQFWSTTLNAVSGEFYYFSEGPGTREPLGFDLPCGVRRIGDTLAIRRLPFSVPDTVGPVIFGACDGRSSANCQSSILLRSYTFENFPVGYEITASRFWRLLDAPSIISGLVAAFPDTTNQAMHLEALISGFGTDVFLDLGDRVSGRYEVEFDIFVVDESSAQFNLQHSTTDNESWAYEVSLFDNGVGWLFAGASAPIQFDYQPAEWITVRQIIDCDRDETQLWIDGARIYSWPFSYNSRNPFGSNQIGALNFFSYQQQENYYVDNIVFGVLPDTIAPGDACATALPVTPGVQPSMPFSCPDDPLSPNGLFNGGYSAKWFTYQATEDGVLSANSCGRSEDTRVWIMSGDCSLPLLLSMNDDQCLTGTGEFTASRTEAVVEGGETYFIIWDSQFSDLLPEWELDFRPGPGEPGRFCATAIPAQIGMNTIDTLDGNNPIAGPSIGVFTNSITPYVRSKFYSFTAPETGRIDITKRSLTDVSSTVWLYSTDCSALQNSELLAFRETGGFSPGVAIDNFLVDRGKEYIIEWTNELDYRGFDFEIEFRPDLADVTYQVETNILETGNGVSSDGMFVEFSNGQQTQLEDQGNGLYSVTLPTRTNRRIDYRFMNGTDISESLANDSCALELNGRWYRGAAIGFLPKILPPVCFNQCVSCDLISSVDRVYSLEDFALAPVPATHELMITWEVTNRRQGIHQFSLIHVSGTAIRTVPINWALGEAVLDLSDLPAGVYFLKPLDVHFSGMLRFVKV